MNLINLTQIIEGERFRVDYGDLQDLVDSILRFGLIQPIVIDQDNKLIAGGRRYRAAQLAGLSEVPYARLSDVDELTLREIELEENIRRKDMTWSEQARLVAEIHALKQQKYGTGHKPNEEGEGGWGMRATANAANLSLAMTSYVIQGARLLEVMPEIEGETSLKNALALVDRTIQLLERELAKRRSSVTDAETTWLGDCRELLKQVASASVDCVIIDPPWGVDLSTREGIHFDDTKEHAIKTLKEALPEIVRVMKPDAHFYCFFATNSTILELLKEAGIPPDPVPLVWVKPNSVGTVDWTRRYGPAYEPIYFYSSGERLLAKQRANVFDYPAPDQRHNIAEKPAALIRELILQSTTKGEVVLDCFCGSGVVPATAKSLGRKFIACELDQEQYEWTLERLRNVELEEEPVSEPTNQSVDFVDEEEEEI